MKKNLFLILFTICLVLVGSHYSSAATYKGRVVAASYEKGETLCDHVGDMTKELAEAVCGSNATDMELILVEGALSKKIKEDTLVILKGKGKVRQKTVAKVISVFRNGEVPEEQIGRLADKNIIILWEDKASSSVAILRAEKGFRPSLGDKVILKMKRPTRNVEGC